MILDQIKKTFDLAHQKGWDKTFWCVDLHDTCIRPNYKYGEIPREFYEYAKETLQILSNRKDVCLIMYTCSHPEEVEQYKQFFAAEGIIFEHVNKNPEVKSQGYGYYEDKPYFNVLFDDKAGFDPYNDWKMIHKYLTEFI